MPNEAQVLRKKAKKKNNKKYTEQWSLGMSITGTFHPHPWKYYVLTCVTSCDCWFCVFFSWVGTDILQANGCDKCQSLPPSLPRFFPSSLPPSFLPLLPNISEPPTSIFRHLECCSSEDLSNCATCSFACSAILHSIIIPWSFGFTVHCGFCSKVASCTTVAYLCVQVQPLVSSDLVYSLALMVLACSMKSEK